jgi:ketosteroid isomerase-like protein
VPKRAARPAPARRPAAALATRRAVERFNAAFNRRDVDAVMALSTEDTVLETTLPKPDGQRFVGHAAVRQYWARFFAETPAARFEAEEIVATGDRCVVRWRFHWGEDRPDAPAHVRGVDLFRIRAGRVSEKLVYVKG